VQLILQRKHITYGNDIESDGITLHSTGDHGGTEVLIVVYLQGEPKRKADYYYNFIYFQHAFMFLAHILVNTRN